MRCEQLVGGIISTQGFFNDHTLRIFISTPGAQMSRFMISAERALVTSLDPGSPRRRLVITLRGYCIDTLKPWSRCAPSYQFEDLTYSEGDPRVPVSVSMTRRTQIRNATKCSAHDACPAVPPIPYVRSRFHPSGMIGDPSESPLWIRLGRSSCPTVTFPHELELVLPLHRDPWLLLHNLDRNHQA